MTVAEYLTVEEAARVLRQSTATIRRKITLGEIEAVRLGEHGPLRVSTDALEEHLRPTGRASVAASVPQQAARSGSGANPEAS